MDSVIYQYVLTVRIDVPDCLRRNDPFMVSDGDDLRNIPLKTRLRASVSYDSSASVVLINEKEMITKKCTGFNQ